MSNFIKGSRVTLSGADQVEADALLAAYRAAKATESNAAKLAASARERLIELIGDSEYAVDSRGTIVYRMGERTRDSINITAAVERAPIIADLVKQTVYRVVGG